MEHTSLRVDLGPRSYDIAVGDCQLDLVGAFARERCPATTALVVTDEHVKDHAAKVAETLERSGFTAPTAVLAPGEAQKSLAIASQLYDQLIELRAGRRTLIVAVGGGVIGDLAGFVAATFVRGLPLLMVPTTLLAMVDSAVGGKVAVNHSRAKNMIGVFHQPMGVWIDTAVLETLPPREYLSGLAEVVKYGVILDAEFFSYLEANVDTILHRDPEVLNYIVTHCCRLKADVVEKDEREESGLRAVLNYGHTFAHAYEIAAGYGTWLHGEAVAAGMVSASRLAERRGFIPADLTVRQIRLLQAFSLPTRPEKWSIDAMIATMRNDKKSLGGRLRFILPTRLGHVALFDDVPDSDVRRALQEVIEE